MRTSEPRNSGIPEPTRSFDEQIGPNPPRPFPGIGVQLTVFWVLADFWGAGYPIASVVGVSAAVVHNFLWHQRWTWRDRRPRGLAALTLVANAIAIAATGMLNLAMSDVFVFKA